MAALPLPLPLLDAAGEAGEEGRADSRGLERRLGCGRLPS